jgi:hypothetical protein
MKVAMQQVKRMIDTMFQPKEQKKNNQNKSRNSTEQTNGKQQTETDTNTN